MKTFQFQIIHFHFSLPLKKRSFIEVADKKENVDFQLADELFKQAYKKEIKAKLAELNASSKKGGVHYIYASKSFLDMLAKHEPTELELLQNNVSSEKMILVGGCAYNSLSYLCSPLFFKKEVQTHIKTLEEYFNYRPHIFINTACIYDDVIAEILAELDYDIAIASASSWHLGEHTSNQYFKANTQKSLGILLAQSSSKNISGIELVNAFGTDYEQAKLKSAQAAAEELLELELEGAPIYSVHLPISSGAWSYHITQYLSSGLQKSFMSECKQLAENRIDQLSESSFQTIFQLLQPAELLKMKSGGEGQAYQQFVNSMNILTSLIFNEQV